jgi:hypothetical protein
MNSSAPSEHARIVEVHADRDQVVARAGQRLARRAERARELDLPASERGGIAGVHLRHVRDQNFLHPTLRRPF